MTLWTPVRRSYIISYLLLACDLKDVKAWKSFRSLNYLQKGLVGEIPAHRIDGNLCYLKYEVEWCQLANAPSQKARICVHRSGHVVTGCCSSMARQANVCSYAGPVLWEVKYEVIHGLTGVICTIKRSYRNRSSKRNVVAAEFERIFYGGSTWKQQARDG